MGVPGGDDMGRNYACKNCWDEGKVGIFFRKMCPVCNGKPYSRLPPRPPPPQGSQESRENYLIRIGKLQPKMVSDITSRALDI